MPSSTQGWGRGFRKLGRKMSHRRALLNNQVTSLIKYDRIVTTVAKAKELRRYADWMVTYAKKSDKRDARREAGKYVKEKEVLERLMTVVAPRYALRPGGYTRVMKIGFRRGDAADMAVVEFIDREGEIKKPKECNMGTIIRNAGMDALLRLPKQRKHVPLAPLRQIPMTVVTAPETQSSTDN